MLVNISKSLFNINSLKINYCKILLGTFISKKNILAKIVIKLRNFIVYFFKNIRLIKTIITKENDDILIKNGIFNNLILVNGYFEDERLIDKKFIKYFKKSKEDDKAKKFLDKLKKNKKQKIFFIHIRLKDNIRIPNVKQQFYPFLITLILLDRILLLIPSFHSL